MLLWISDTSNFFFQAQLQKGTRSKQQENPLLRVVCRFFSLWFSISRYLPGTRIRSLNKYLEVRYPFIPLSFFKSFILLLPNKVVYSSDFSPIDPHQVPAELAMFTGDTEAIHASKSHQAEAQAEKQICRRSRFARPPCVPYRLPPYVDFRLASRHSISTLPFTNQRSIDTSYPILSLASPRAQPGLISFTHSLRELIQPLLHHLSCFSSVLRYASHRPLFLAHHFSTASSMFRILAPHHCLAFLVGPRLPPLGVLVASPAPPA